jgi:hypothetical protein
MSMKSRWVPEGVVVPEVYIHTVVIKTRGYCTSMDQCESLNI